MQTNLSTTMNNFRTYGDPPYSVAVIHGGPGAPGEMAPVARELSRAYGVLEPLQTTSILDGQIRELRDILEAHGTLPITLVGHSWGAMLGYMFSAQNPAFVKKLILVASGVFDEAYVSQIAQTRLSRLTENDRVTLQALFEKLNDPKTPDTDALFMRYGEIFDKTDSFDPSPHAHEIIRCQYVAFEHAWRDMEQLRKSGELLAYGRQISCPVVAIHGDYDPHPADGVRIPISRVVRDFRFILLNNCGHTPWIERGARERFYKVLFDEV
ncbi:MAG: alpha/beta hydrolase, partial [Methanoregula sp.]|nr:alpha/beta hydrolase [Methanoregula sp.]